MSFKNALRMPIIIRYDSKLVSLKGKLRADESIHSKMLIFGFGDVSVVDSKGVLNIEGDLVLSGDAHFGNGSKLDIRKGATLLIGKNMQNTAGLEIICAEKITIGDNFLSSWNTCLMDTDFHPYSSRGEQEPIVVGDNVWMGMKSTILKGSHIPDNCVIGACSLVNKKFNKESSLIVGVPAVEKTKK